MTSMDHECFAETGMAPPQWEGQTCRCPECGYRFKSVYFQSVMEKYPELDPATTHPELLVWCRE